MQKIREIWAKIFGCNHKVNAYVLSKDETHITCAKCKHKIHKDEIDVVGNYYWDFFFKKKAK